MGGVELRCIASSSWDKDASTTVVRVLSDSAAVSRSDYSEVMKPLVLQTGYARTGCKHKTLHGLNLICTVHTFSCSMRLDFSGFVQVAEQRHRSALP